ncbi:hypothetical protein F4777DRAFT_600703 [Nemania sp. FL0916]|nr:hypothetical protein F4777DRAFT_600703 [Nemania sp. FL0916]
MTATSQQTLGIELEFIVFYQHDWDPISDHDIVEYSPVPRIPYDITPSENYAGWELDNDSIYNHYIRTIIADIIAKAGFRSKASPWAEDPDPELLKVWNVVPDASLKPALYIPEYSDLCQTGVEINSPVFYAGDEAFHEISAVVKAITSSVRTAVPPICGLHVHVGRGRVPLELRPVQRTASLLWLAEGLIDTLHPGCRLGNEYCRSMRAQSMLRQQVIPATVATPGPEMGRGIPRERQHAEFSTLFVNQDRAKPTKYHYVRPANIISDPDSTPSRSLAVEYDCSLISYGDSETEKEPDKNEFIHGIEKILEATDVEVVAMLVNNGNRGAYNFCNLVSSKDELIHITTHLHNRTDEETPDTWECSDTWECHQAWGYPKSEANSIPTIEFRQAAGSLDEKWIVAWAKICLALNGPAVVESSDKDFFQLLHNCLKAKELPKEYDVFDLLHDIGLGREDINTVYKRLHNGRHEEEPVLLFYAEEDRPDKCYEDRRWLELNNVHVGYGDL